MLIKQISAEETWPLRHLVMWPDKPFDFVKIPEDVQGLHFGAFVEGKLVSVVSLFIEGTEAQFRKFATHVHEQGKGYGTALIQHVLQFAQQNRVELIWCDTREHKANFYTRLGMVGHGSPFIKNGKPYIRMEKLIEADQ